MKLQRVVSAGSKANLAQAERLEQVFAAVGAIPYRHRDAGMQGICDANGAEIAGNESSAARNLLNIAYGQVAAHLYIARYGTLRSTVRALGYGRAAGLLGRTLDETYAIDREFKLDDVVSRSLECEPRRWKIVEHLREKVTCRDCEGVTETPAPSHSIPRGFAGPNLLASVLVSKFMLHQPLNRQGDTFAREGIATDTSALADRVGACAVALAPIVEAIRCHVLSAERIHGDDTTVPVLARGKTDTGRLWTYMRDDRPFGGAAPPAAAFHSSRGRSGEYPRGHLATYGGLLQADAYAGYNDLHDGGRRPAPIREAACWSHGRRKFFDIAKLTKAPIAVEAVRRIDEIFAVERNIDGRGSAERMAARQRQSKPLIFDLEIYLIKQQMLLSTKSDTAKAIHYILNR